MKFSFPKAQYSLLFLLFAGVVLSSCEEEVEYVDTTKPEGTNVNSPSSVKLHIEYTAPEGWKKDHGSSVMRDRITYNGSEATPPIESYISLECKHISDSTYKIMEPAFIDQLSLVYGSDKKAKISQSTIDGARALKIETSVDYIDKTTQTITTIVFVNSREYWFEMNVKKEDYNQAIKEYDALISSIHFLK